MTYAVWLMYAGAALSVVVSAIGALTAHSLVSAMVAQMQSRMPASQAGATLPTGFMTRVYTGALIAGGLLNAGLWLWMAWKNGAGRSWARVLSTVFFGLFCFSTLASIVQINSALVMYLIMNLIVLAVALAAVILIWRPEASQYYQAVKWQSAPWQMPPGGYGYPPAPPMYGYGYGSPQSAYGQMPPMPPQSQPPQPPDEHGFE